MGVETSMLPEGSKVYAWIAVVSATRIGGLIRWARYCRDGSVSSSARRAIGKVSEIPCVIFGLCPRPLCRPAEPQNRKRELKLNV